MQKKIYLAVLMGSALMTATSAFAQSDLRFSFDGRPERLFRPISGLNRVDLLAIKDAATANLLEIHTSELALKYGQSDWVRQFAKEMVEEHRAAHEELRLVAMKKGVSVPESLPPAKQKLVNQLAKLRGSAFDRKYREIQLMGHRETSAKLQRDIRNGHDQDVRGYLVRTLPSVKMHYRMAMMGKTMTGSTKMEHNG